MMQQEINLQSMIARKISIVLGLGAVATIHLLDLPGKWNEVRYIAFLYILTILASVIIAERLLKHGSKLDYLAAAAVCASSIVGYLLNRTVGLPGAMGDIGNWLEPLGFISLFVEAWTMFQALTCFSLQAKTANRS
jgi:hypothetical protein